MCPPPASVSHAATHGPVRTCVAVPGNTGGRDACWRSEPRREAARPLRAGRGRVPAVVVLGGAAAGRLERRRGDALHRPEHDVVAFGVDDDRLAGLELLPEDLLRERVLDHALDRPPQRTSAELRVVALLGEQQLGLVRELEVEALPGQLLDDPLDQQVDDVGDVLGRQLVEDDDLVDAVQELGAEVALQLLVDLVLHPLVGDRLVGLDETDRRLAQVGRAEVRRHDDHGVLEVDRATLRVGEPPVLEDLQQRVEHVGVRLLDLVEEHHGERLAPHGLGELTTFVVADVAGR